MSDQMPHDEELRALYRKLPADEPPSTLDDVILSAARRRSALKKRRTLMQRVRWTIPLAAAAGIVLTLTLTRLTPEQGTTQTVSSQALDEAGEGSSQNRFAESDREAMTTNEGKTASDTQAASPPREALKSLGYISDGAPGVGADAAKPSDNVAPPHDAARRDGSTGDPVVELERARPEPAPQAGSSMPGDSSAGLAAAPPSAAPNAQAARDAAAERKNPAAMPNANAAPDAAMERPATSPSASIAARRSIGDAMKAQAGRPAPQEARPSGNAKPAAPTPPPAPPAGLTSEVQARTSAIAAMKKAESASLAAQAAPASPEAKPQPEPRPAAPPPAAMAIEEAPAKNDAPPSIEERDAAARGVAPEAGNQASDPRACALRPSGSSPVDRKALAENDSAYCESEPQLPGAAEETIRKERELATKQREAWSRWPFNLEPWLEEKEACRRLTSALNAPCKFVGGIAVVRPSEPKAMDGGISSGSMLSQIKLTSRDGKVATAQLNFADRGGHQMLIAPEPPR